MTVPESQEIESEVVFLAINSFAYFDLWVFVSPNIDLPLLLSFAQQGQSVKAYFVCLLSLLRLEFEQRSVIRQYRYTYHLSVNISHLADCKVGVHANLTFDLGNLVASSRECS